MAMWGNEEAALAATLGERRVLIWGFLGGRGAWGLGLGLDWVGTGPRVGSKSIMKWLTPGGQAVKAGQ
jgi:hypothetical protein